MLADHHQKGKKCSCTQTVSLKKRRRKKKRKMKIHKYKSSYCLKYKRKREMRWCFFSATSLHCIWNAAAANTASFHSTSTSFSLSFPLNLLVLHAYIWRRREEAKKLAQFWCPLRYVPIMWCERKPTKVFSLCSQYSIFTFYFFLASHHFLSLAIIRYICVGFDFCLNYIASETVSELLFFFCCWSRIHFSLLRLTLRHSSRLGMLLLESRRQ